MVHNIILLVYSDFYFFTFLFFFIFLCFKDELRRVTFDIAQKTSCAMEYYYK